MIFETKRLLVRKLALDDLQAFHEMQSNPKVMQYVTGDVKSLEEHETELKDLITKYDKPNNDFWIYAIVEKSTNNFLGTVALVKDESDDEIGYRFLEKYWGRGYGFEVSEGLITYSESIGKKKLIAYVVDKNVASAKIIEKLGFKSIKKFVSDDLKLPETKYQLTL